MITNTYNSLEKQKRDKLMKVQQSVSDYNSECKDGSDLNKLISSIRSRTSVKIIVFRTNYGIRNIFYICQNFP